MKCFKRIWSKLIPIYHCVLEGKGLQVPDTRDMKLWQSYGNQILTDLMTAGLDHDHTYRMKGCCPSNHTPLNPASTHRAMSKQSVECSSNKTVKFMGKYGEVRKNGMQGHIN